MLAITAETQPEAWAGLRICFVPPSPIPLHRQGSSQQE